LPTFPRLLPQLHRLEDRLVPASGITEYTVTTSSAQPLNLTLGPDGNVWFTEYAVNKIAKITTSGTITEYALSTNYINPYDVTAGPDGNLWFTEQCNGMSTGPALGKSTTGGSITDYNAPAMSGGPFTYLSSTLGSNGDLYVSALNKVVYLPEILASMAA
jgi:virginiamycin B lyase